MKETAKTIALVVLGVLYVILALNPPEVPRRVEHEVELTPAFVALKAELVRTQDALASANAEAAKYKAAVADAAAEKERDARWAAAGDAEARGAVRTASRLYGEYAKLYAGTKRAQVATWKSKKLLADLDAKNAAAAGGQPASPNAAAGATPAAPAPPRGLGSGTL